MRDSSLKVSDVSVIVSVYKDVDALRVIMAGLADQSVDGFEVIVSEDGESDEMAEFIGSQPFEYVKHLTCHDMGWRKNLALNKAIVTAKGSYLIFIDGDCVPHRRFVEAHISLSRPSQVLSGRRVDVGGFVSAQIKAGRLSIRRFESVLFILINMYGLLKAGSKNIEDGLYIEPGSLFARHILPRLSKIRGILGCNFSCWKGDLLLINGFDEDYVSPAVGEDTDLEWRFKGVGVGIRSCRSMAIVYHFRHPLRFDGFDENLNKMHKKEAGGIFFCVNGIEKGGIDLMDDCLR
jgi:glycosyltransferase involved in cell wall biosynthesis